MASVWCFMLAQRSWDLQHKGGGMWCNPRREGRQLQRLWANKQLCHSVLCDGLLLAPVESLPSPPALCYCCRSPYRIAERCSSTAFLTAGLLLDHLNFLQHHCKKRNTGQAIHILLRRARQSLLGTCPFEKPWLNLVEKVVSYLPW